MKGFITARRVCHKHFIEKTGDQVKALKAPVSVQHTKETMKKVVSEVQPRETRSLIDLDSCSANIARQESASLTNKDRSFHKNVTAQNLLVPVQSHSRNQFYSLK